MGKKILWIAAGLFLLLAFLFGQLIPPQTKTDEGAAMSEFDRARVPQQQSDLQHGENPAVQR
jgi:hypothetical protein